MNHFGLFQLLKTPDVRLFWRETHVLENNSDHKNKNQASRNNSDHKNKNQACRHQASKIRHKTLKTTLTTGFGVVFNVKQQDEILVLKYDSAQRSSAPPRTPQAEHIF
jgi:hypothetical protein